MKEWYPAVVTGANANRYKWSVRYTDNDTDNNLCWDCVRRFIPYRIGEKVQIRLEIDEEKVRYFPGTLKSVDSIKNEYSILLDTGTIIQNATISELRRDYYDRTELAPDTRVKTLYPGIKGEWFVGRIIQINADKTTYRVEYDDGDYLSSVPRDEIQILSETD